MHIIMKLRYLFSIILSALFFAGCADISTDSWDNIKLSQTYVSIPVEGGSAKITIDATEDWAFQAGEDWPEWLTVDNMSGAAGETTVTFTADANQGREAELVIKAGDNSQFVRVRQGSLAAASATCAEIIAGPDGKTYRTKGVVTSIANTTYGNWYLKDDTGEIYIYGTLDKDGKEKNFLSLGIEAGDVVTVEGPKTTYGTTIELVNVTVISIEKAFAKIITDAADVEKEGGQFDVKVVYKGEGLFPSVPEQYRSWVSIVDVQNREGVPTKIEPNPADTAVVKVSVLPNEGGAREASVEFTSSTTTVSYSFSQKGSIVETTVADFLKAPVGTTLYKLTGKVKNLKPGDYGNFHLEDATGSVYVYGLTATPVSKNDKSFPSLGIKEGDVVTLIGTRARYDNASKEEEKDQVGGPAYYVSHVGHTEATVAEFLAKEKSSKNWYKLTGTIEEIVSDSYGNFYLNDGTGRVYVYGLTVAPVAKNDKSFSKLGLKVGDKVTLIGTRDRYDKASKEDQKDQVGGPAYYVSHE